MVKRRDAGRRRGKPIEDAILAATLDELANHGLEGVSIARIAKAAEVNKTTIYRRWGDLDKLILAALERSLADVTTDLQDTGSLKGDLLGMIDTLGAHMSSPQGRALTRAALSERATEFLHIMSQKPLAQSHEAVVGIVMRAVARGDWDIQRCPPETVLMMVAGSVMNRTLLGRQPVTPQWAQIVVDVIVRGVAPEP